MYLKNTVIVFLFYLQVQTAELKKMTQKKFRRTTLWFFSCQITLYLILICVEGLEKTEDSIKNAKHLLTENLLPFNGDEKLFNSKNKREIEGSGYELSEFDEKSDEINWSDVKKPTDTNIDKIIKSGNVEKTHNMTNFEGSGEEDNESDKQLQSEHVPIIGESEIFTTTVSSTDDSSLSPSDGHDIIESIPTNNLSDEISSGEETKTYTTQSDDAVEELTTKIPLHANEGISTQDTEVESETPKTIIDSTEVSNISADTDIETEEKVESTTVGPVEQEGNAILTTATESFEDDYSTSSESKAENEDLLSTTHEPVTDFIQPVVVVSSMQTHPNNTAMIESEEVTTEATQDSSLLGISEESNLSNNASTTESVLLNLDGSSTLHKLNDSILPNLTPKVDSIDVSPTPELASPKPVEAPVSVIDTLATQSTEGLLAVPEQTLTTEEPDIEHIFTETKIPQKTMEAPPGNILHKKNMTLGVDPLLIVTNTKLVDSEEGDETSLGDSRRLGAYIIIGLILLSFLTLIGYITLKKRKNRRKHDFEANPESHDTEKALLSLSDYKDSTELEENHLKNNEITPIVVKSNSQINKFEKNTNLSFPKNLNTIANQKNIEKDNVLKSTTENLTQVIIEETPKDVEEEKNSPTMEKLIVKTHVDQDSIPKKPVIVNRSSTGYVPIPQDNS